MWMNTLQVREEDQNQDGKLDILILNIQLPVKPEEQVHSVQLLLTFSYKLFVCIPLSVYTHIMLLSFKPVSCILRHQSKFASLM